MRLRYFAALACASLLFSLTTYAQVSINGSLRGRISDPTSAGLSGATLTLTNTATAVTQKAGTDDKGEYQFARVPPGIYILSAEKDGFKRGQRESIIIAVNENAIANLALTVGQISETVAVEAGAAIVQSQSVELSGLVSERRVKELPLNGRNFIKLVQLAPGVGNPGSANNPPINGGCSVTNSYVVDGIGSNDERLNTGFVGVNGSNTDLGQNVPNLISTEAIQEYRIITSNADATFGRGSGGHINLVTKSGGNEWHGSAYEYLRNDALDAADYFYKANPRPQFRTEDGKAKTPPFKQNLYGGAFGGRIVRDRHFFFGSYEGFQQRRLNQTASNLVVPNADLLRFVPGDLGQFLKTFFIDRGIIPAGGNPAGTFTPLPVAERNAIVAAGFPTAFFDGNAANGEAGTVQISAAPPINIEQNAFLVRTDHQLTERLAANVRYSFAHSFVTAGSATPLDTQVAPRQYQSAAVQFNYNLTAAQALEVRGGVLRNRFEQFTQGGIDFNDDGDATADRPALTGGSLNDLYFRGAGERTQFLLTQNEALARLATPTTIDPAAMIPRNALRAPRVMFYDLALLKRFVVKERYHVGFEANFFNLFNRANFGAPVSNLSNALFGRITSNLSGTNPRQIQFGLKLSF